MNHKSFWQFMASHLLFYFGHLISLTWTKWSPNWFGRMYPLYNWVMCKSLDLDKKCRLWKKVEGEVSNDK